jgi:hypothetical protein
MEKMEDYRTRNLESYLSDPILGNAFKEIIKFCASPRTKDEIEEYVKKELGITYEKHRVYAGYFIGALEGCGGIRWDREKRRWVATEAGKKAVS